jgi:hypothetical protein
MSCRPLTEMERPHQVSLLYSIFSSLVAAKVQAGEQAALKSGPTPPAGPATPNCFPIVQVPRHTRED